eukprot:TRINITY_DN2018_c0_g1_i1.p1 TRINITY_DN2018_c0_g1~~TRINITY_DN2018_c0_g1_i1.p1  ORF type:complete len:262 (+),score=50.11 TRINITY_DN2018_c0_g1_i1:112-786(+)
MMKAGISCSQPWSPPLEDDRQLIFGIGTGRCGTMSLHKLLSLQPNTTVTHEMSPHFPWNATRCERQVKVASWTEILLRRPKQFMGDIASWYLPYVTEILELYPRTKILCLKRDKDSVVESFARRADQYNHWQDASVIEASALNLRWNTLFPHYNDAVDREEAIGRYWDDYYLKVEDLLKKYGDNTVRIVDTVTFFRNAEVQSEVLNWLGFKSPITSTSIKENKR